MDKIVIALVGNPNCGKTSLFNALTGARQSVGNWPGVTVEKKSGAFRYAGVEVEVIDLPGVYSLDASGEGLSLDERVAYDVIRAGTLDLIVNVVDAANLERNLYLTSQLAELGAPLLVALNMTDVAEKLGRPVAAEKLAAAIGCPVVPIVAARQRGIAKLKEAILAAARNPQRPQIVLPAIDPATPDADLALAAARYALVGQWASAAVSGQANAEHRLTARIDRIVLHRWLGLPIFFGVMYLMFMFTIKLGGAFVDFFDQVAGALLVEWPAAWLAAAGAPEWLVLLLAKGVGSGLQTVATFVPIIGAFYLFLSALEDSGYMARAAFVMDRLLRWLGLPGKSFVPLVVGFGCNVPAIMATRTLEGRRDRQMTIAMAPFMSCSARLPVYVLFAAAFFPEGGQNVVFALYLIGIAVAIATGLALKNTLLVGPLTPFAMELPLYHLPVLRNLALHAGERLKGFIVRAGRVIVPMVLVINMLHSVGADGSLGNEDSEKSVLAVTSRAIAPVFAPLGLTTENWPATVGIFTGILAKEAVVGTLNATYAALGEKVATEKEGAPLILTEKLAAAFATIPEKLGEALSRWADPLGLAVGDLSDPEAAAEKAEVTTTVFGAMASRFDGAAGAFAYLLFILLYTPCTAALAAIYQESGARWMAFVAIWTFGLAYGIATLAYQGATWAQHPGQSLAWGVGVPTAFALAFFALRRWGQKRPQRWRLVLAGGAGCKGCSNSGQCGQQG